MYYQKFAELKILVHVIEKTGFRKMFDFDAELDEFWLFEVS